MVYPLIALINETIDSNLNGKAVIYYDGLSWFEQSYASLKSWTNKIQNIFNKKTFTCRNHYVLLHLEITSTFPAIVLGILNAGFGFFCVEPGKEHEISQNVEELSIPFIISNVFVNSSHARSFGDSAVFELNFSIGNETIGLWCTGNKNDNVNEAAFLYAIRTSGTTGAPKTIHVPHDCIFPNLLDLSAMLQITNNDSIMLMAPATFDPSVVELFLGLMNGAALYIVEKNLKMNPDSLLDLLFPPSGGLISIMQMTPSIFKRWDSSVIHHRLFSEKSLLKHLILGGEAFPSTNEIKSWNVPEKVNVYNIYGITEVSCWASVNKVWPAKEILIDIGKPLSETILKLDCDGDEGELLIGSKTRKCLVNDEPVEQINNTDATLFRQTGDIFKVSLNPLRPEMFRNV